MFRNIKFITILLLFLSSALIDARAEEVLSWEDCVREAIENHPELISAEEELKQAKADKVITASDFLPQIDSDASKKTSKTAASREKFDTSSYSITGRQLLFDGLKTFYDISADSESIKSSRYNYIATSSNVRLRLRTAFVEFLKAQELLHITEDIAKRRKQNVELIKLRYEAGREHKGSLLTAQADLSQAEFEVAQAERSIVLAQRRLTKELGRRKLTPMKVKGDFDIRCSYHKKPDLEGLAEDTPFLQELIAQRESAKFDLRSAQADFFPQVYTNASAGKTSSAWPPHRDEWSVGMSLSLPIFEGGSRIAEVSKAKSVFNQAQADERNKRDNVILALEETWTELQDAIDNVRVQQKFLEAAEERARIAQAQYSTGLISFDDWTIIEDELVKFKKSFLDIQANALIAKAKWVQAKGWTLDYE